MVPFPALGIHSAGADPIHPRFLLAPFFFFPFESVDLILYKFHFLDNLPVAVAISLLPPSPSSLPFLDEGTTVMMRKEERTNEGRRKRTQCTQLLKSCW